MKPTERKIVRRRSRSGLRLIVVIALSLATGATPAALAQDCDGDGIDDQDQLMEYRSTYGWGLDPDDITPDFEEGTPEVDGMTLLFPAPPALSDVTLVLDSAVAGWMNQADPDEYLLVYMNDTLIGHAFESPGEDTFVIPQATWETVRTAANWVNYSPEDFWGDASDRVEITVEFSVAATPDLGGSVFYPIGGITVSYTIDRDVNDNGWLDDCIPDGDPSGPDSDGDGVSDNIDRSPNTIADPSLVDVYGRLLRVARFDVDEDGDVDVNDLDSILLDATARDVDGDGDFDLHDLASIMQGARGPGVAADPAFLQQLQLFEAHTFGPEDLDIKPWYKPLDGVYHRSYNNGNLLSQALYGTHLAAIDKTGATSLSQSEQIAQLSELTAASGSAMSWIGMKWSQVDTLFMWENGQFFDTSDGSVSNWRPGSQIPGSGFFTPGQDDYYVFTYDEAGSGAAEDYYWLNADGVSASLGGQTIEGFVAQLPANTVPAAPATVDETVTVTLDSSVNGQTVAPGQIIDWTISFEVTSDDNSGLALLVTDLVQDLNNSTTFDLSVGDAAPYAMQNFAADQGFTGAGGFGGELSGTIGARNLVQIGGAQNTFGGLSSETSHGQSSTVVTGVGHGATTVLATGSFTAPTTLDSYTLNLTNTLASVLKSVGGAGSETVPANVEFNQSSITFTVADLCVGDSDGDGICDDVDACLATNDTCANALPISDGVYSGCSTDATNDGASTCGNSNASPDVWYVYTATCDGSAEARTCGAGTAFDTVLAVFADCGASELTCNDDGCGGTSHASQVSWPVTAGTEYLVRVTGYNGQKGDFELTVDCEPAPVNDTCASATALVEGTVAGSTAAASIESAGPCDTSPARDVWYVYTNDTGVDVTVTADLCSSATTFDTVLGAYDACGGTEVACNDDADACNGPNPAASTLIWTVPCGATHWLQLSSYGDIPGEFEMSVTLAANGPDSDGDGIGDACDACPGFDDALDADGDGVADGCDLCIGTDASGDTDGDGVCDDTDGCPNDPNKTEPGICGCGLDDSDSDTDGTADCIDGCPSDPNKTEPGICGCDVADTDSDSDGTADCNDGCPGDPDKVEPGVCGCGVADVDQDGDTVMACFDCDDTDESVYPGNDETVCDGLDNDCDAATLDFVDGDADSVCDAYDNCPLYANTDQADCDGDGVGDICTIGDGLDADCNDNGVPDGCDIDHGTSADADGSGVPDECEVVPCSTHADCADLDGNGIRDDGCVFWSCDAGACVGTEIVFADMGGQFGLCDVDGTADGNDRFHALNCFANTDPNGGGDYSCEVSAPAAFNVDAGGQFGSCVPDGVCDGNDAFAALNAFGGSSSCSCPLDGAPAPAVDGGGAGVEIVDRVTIKLIARPVAGDRVEIDVFLTGGVSDLRGYQLHPTASAGLTLVDLFVDTREDHAFIGEPFWDAYNLETGQLVVGLDTEGIRARGDVYLATFVYRAEAGHSEGVVDLLHDMTDASNRTFLFATPANGMVEIVRTKPAVIHTRGKAAPAAQPR